MGRVIEWIDYRLPVFTFLRRELNEYPTPRNLNYLWNFGSLSGIVLVVMIVTGIVLAMHYTPTTAGAFDSPRAVLSLIICGRTKSAAMWRQRNVCSRHLRGLFFVPRFCGCCRYDQFQTSAEAGRLAGQFADCCRTKSKHDPRPIFVGHAPAPRLVTAARARLRAAFGVNGH